MSYKIPTYYTHIASSYIFVIYFIWGVFSIKEQFNLKYKTCYAEIYKQNNKTFAQEAASIF